MIYLDNSSTTRQYDEVTEEMLKVMREGFGNPSSLHKMGFEAEKVVKRARRLIVNKIAGSGDFVFTSGGTESDNMALFGAARARKRLGNRIIISQTEHPAILESAKALSEKGFEVIKIGVDKDGVIDLDELKSAINDKTILISVMTVNNETGTIQPIQRIAMMKQNAIFHTDAVQAFGKMKVPTDGVDMISISGHKIHGPKGIGGLWIAKKSLNIRPFILGGGQESGMRSGTENVPAIAGLARAAELIGSSGRLTELRDTLLQGIEANIPDIKVNSPEGALPAVLNISFLGTRGEVILHELERSGIYVSTGAACSSNKNAKSHVLKAMGLDSKEIEGAIRFSFSEFNTPQEMEIVTEKVTDAVKRFRKLGGAN